MPSQRAEALRRFGSEPGLVIVDVFEEAMSAKAPGRPVFNDMMARIEAGEAEGIIAWAPDRLARNSIDGGRVVYLLDTHTLSDLKFLTYTFENNPQGKFMLSIMFGQSKYYSDALSENVKRGNRAKIERGWRPNFAPIGYLNDPLTKTIVVDPLLFPMVKRMFELALGGRSSRQIARVAQFEWGMRSRKRKRSGGTPIGTSSVYGILTNPFYAGLILWNGQIYPGKHEAAVSIEEFQAVGRALAGGGKPKPQRHTFAYTGIIRCGSCGLMITAEHKTNKYGSKYVYYHCTKRMDGPRCREPSVEVSDLERQILDFLRTIALDPSIEEWLNEQLALEAGHESELANKQRQSLQRAIEAIEHELRELTGLRTRSLIDDAEFVQERERLTLQRIALSRQLEAKPEQNGFELFRCLISFNVLAVFWFENGDDEDRRAIMEIIGSNSTLTYKILNIQAAKPFRDLREIAPCLGLRTAGNDVRTSDALRTRIDDCVATINELLPDRRYQKMIKNLRVFRTRRDQLGTLRDGRDLQAEADGEDGEPNSIGKHP